VLKDHLAFAGILLATSVSALSQQPVAPAAAPPAARPPQAPLQIPNPHYITIPMTIDVSAPADKVWARIGKYCDIGEWSNAPGGNTCRIISGTDGEPGAVRTVGNEVLVGKTKYSYTYAQAPRDNTPYNLYHGTLEVVPLTAKTSRINYTLFYDNSMLADDAAREADINSRRTRFTTRLTYMKSLAEGGTMPPPVAMAPSPGGAAKPAAYLSPNPHYVSIPMEMEVNAPVDKVWGRIGKYCDIGEWGFPGCTIISGKDGEFGAVRTIGTEVLVGKTKYSYVYTQSLRTGSRYIMYHGTLEARALTPTTTQLYYTLLFDNSNLADDAAREADLAHRRTAFTGMLQNMKILSEGGTLPPGAVRTPGRPATPPSTK
jgi:Polyketide cyclase / dehydrase and lipid transport